MLGGRDGEREGEERDREERRQGRRNEGKESRRAQILVGSVDSICKTNRPKTPICHHSTAQ